MIIAGIDFSMTCPSICVHDMENEFTFENCEFHYLTDKKYLVGDVMSNVHGTWLSAKDFDDDMWRFSTISDWAMDVMAKVRKAAIEGYSMGSRGRVFNIGENTGILKYRILHGIEKSLEIYSPKEIKMFAVNNTSLDFSAVNKNKIDKDHMFSIFLEETRTNLMEIMTPKKKKVDSPVGDIVDSYYICKMLRKTLERES